MLAERLDADQQAQTIPGSCWSLSWLLGECHVQSGSKRIEASHRCGVLAAGQIQAWAPVEGSLNFGLRSTQTRSP